VSDLNANCLRGVRDVIAVAQSAPPVLVLGLVPIPFSGRAARLGAAALVRPIVRAGPRRLRRIYKISILKIGKIWRLDKGVPSLLNFCGGFSTFRNLNIYIPLDEQSAVARDFKNP
jgi:hypothetical protein